MGSDESLMVIHQGPIQEKASRYRFANAASFFSDPKIEEILSLFPQ